jgi:hypothetical protein
MRARLYRPITQVNANGHAGLLTEQDRTRPPPPRSPDACKRGVGGMRSGIRVPSAKGAMRRSGARSWRAPDRAGFVACDNGPTTAVPFVAMSTSAYAERERGASTPALFGRVMGLVAVTVGFATLGVWLGRNAGGATWFISWLVAIGCLFGLQFANTRGNTGLALVLLFAFGLLIGVSISITVNYYSAVDPTAVRQACGATALFVGVLGSGGTRCAVTCRSCIGSRSLDCWRCCWRGLC